MIRRRMRIGALLILATLILVALADLVGARFLQADERRLNDVIAHARDRASGYRRITVDASPLDENAAVHYQLAYKELQPSTNDALARVLRAATRDEPATWETVFRQDCREISSPRVSTALRCTRCDWMLYLQSGEPPGFPFFPQTAILGYCVVLAGRLEQQAGNGRAAADRYFQALAYASDVSQGSSPMVLPGILVSKAALRSLAQLTASVHEAAPLLPIIKQKLSMFRGRMPSLTPGLSEDSAQLAHDLYQIERSAIDRPRTPLRRLWPWRAIAAWQLWRSVRLAAGLDVASSIVDLDQLRQLGPQIDRDGAPGRAAVVYRLDERWGKMIQEIEMVQELFAAVQTSVPLQEWRVAHGSYPGTLPASQVSPAYDLSYRPSSNNHQYQLVSRTGAVVLDVNDGATGATHPED